MKAVAVLHSESTDWAKQAALIDGLIARGGFDLSLFELWVLHGNAKPEQFPAMAARLDVVRRIESPTPDIPESWLGLLEQTSRAHPADLFLFGGDGTGEEGATRLAFRLDAGSCLLVENARKVGGRLEVEKPAYANNLQATLSLSPGPWCLAAAPRAVEPLPLAAPTCTVEDMTGLAPVDCGFVRSARQLSAPAPNDLENAPFILAVGLGAGNRENMTRLERLARSLGACIGASRPVVMNAWADWERLIGVSGRMVAPKLCMAAGVSGAGAFRVGIEGSDFIVAVNTDEDAPIFQIADVGVVDDLTDVLQALEDIVQGGGVE